MKSQTHVMRGLRSWPVQRSLWQLGITALILLGWEYVPRSHYLSTHEKIFNPFFVSSPSAIAHAWYSLSVTGEGYTKVLMWSYLRTTVVSTLLGTSIGLALGALAGLIFSNTRRGSEVVRPFIILANSVPRIALIPIFVVLVGPTTEAAVISVIAVVFFLGFFNAFEGGRSVRQPVLENAVLLGASTFEILRSIRLPLVLAWTFASVPNAISFGLIVAVTTELLTGIQGMGALLQTSMANVQVANTFAIIVVLSVVGLLMYGGATLIRNRAIKWEM